VTSPPRRVTRADPVGRGPEPLPLFPHLRPAGAPGRVREPSASPSTAQKAPPAEAGTGTADPRLQALLRDLGDRVRPGGGPSLSNPPLATGIAPLDRLLGGGFPAGRLSAIGGPASCGRTSLGQALLARTTRRGEFAAWVDWADAFDPVSAEAAGVDLERVLWVRPD